MRGCSFTPSVFNPTAAICAYVLHQGTLPQDTACFKQVPTSRTNNDSFLPLFEGLVILPDDFVRDHSLGKL